MAPSSHRDGDDLDSDRDGDGRDCQSNFSASASARASEPSRWPLLAARRPRPAGPGPQAALSECGTVAETTVTSESLALRLTQAQWQAPRLSTPTVTVGCLRAVCMPVHPGPDHH